MKWVLIFLAAVILLMGSIVPLAGMMVTKGLENPRKSWAPGLTQKGARMRMFFGNYAAAAKIWERAASTWPAHPDHPRMLYRVAFCLEKSGNVKLAIAWYEKYLASHPSHSWKEQAQRRLVQLKGV
ncbi:MAG: tetratricopeptide repeat protein [Victivallales bacterium]|jgi:outer membrane protein assembly factor BamD (BamD/ComL family)|nr:tetratricopeptide repeat protein [Victivallales bacterium]MBT7298851.1 tetratricopeptide repeat protein [Victivallales bacterium]